jgi:hypothetical protein
MAFTKYDLYKIWPLQNMAFTKYDLYKIWPLQNMTFTKCQQWYISFENSLNKLPVKQMCYSYKCERI